MCAVALFFVDNSPAQDQSYDCCTHGTEFTLLIAKVALGDPAILMKVARAFAVFIKHKIRKIHC